ncbi:IS3 family transposase [Streptomyces sp. SID14478]|uniref:IS3 family transposase n=1 Tax=Streptomyces sp. SID14478 TaxID=2706073 RepID=UPI0013DA0D2A|nr:IS3 family transposase [Streptomyces sp. SID14478]
MGNKYTKRYTEEFKRDAIALVDSSGKTVTAVARELGISSESLRGWYRRAKAARAKAARAKAARGEGAPGELTSAEREELRRLRKENREQQQTIEILKKGDGLLREGERPVTALYRLIHAEKANYPVILLSRVLHVTRSSYYYAWREGGAVRQARQAADDALAHEITVLHIASRKTYGVPRIHAELRRLGRRANRKRVARVMRERGIRGVTRRKRRSLTRPGAKAKPAPDLIGRDFHAERPGTKLVGDITYLPTAEGWLYLACWLDLATREVVGYAMADHHRAELVVDALDMAHGRGDLESGCVVHSDRGSEYTSAQFRDQIIKLGLRQSCGRTGSCFDNAAAESFWALLKEEIGTRFWPDRATARAEVFNFIETFYNRRRLRKHKIFGYLTPAETRQRHQHALAA